MRQLSLIESLPAGGTINPYRIVRGGSNGYVYQASGSTGPFLGISLETTTESGDNADFVIGGLHYVQAGGAITVTGNGVECTADSSGRAVPASAGNHVACVVLESAVQDQLVRCRVVSYKI